MAIWYFLAVFGTFSPFYCFYTKKSLATLLHVTQHKATPIGKILSSNGVDPKIMLQCGGRERINNRNN
jgi:hypothetical protein